MSLIPVSLQVLREGDTWIDAGFRIQLDLL